MVKDASKKKRAALILDYQEARRKQIREKHKKHMHQLLIARGITPDDAA